MPFALCFANFIKLFEVLRKIHCFAGWTGADTLKLILVILLGCGVLVLKWIGAGEQELVVILVLKV